MRYLLGSSFFDGGKNGPDFRRDFAAIWSENNARADIQPTRTVVICDGGSKRPHVGWNTDVIRLTGNLGNCYDLLEGRKIHDHSGWSAAVCVTAMIAYQDEAHLIWKEEDCLAFGPWVQRMYDDLNGGCIVFGAKMKSAPWMPCAQSLFLVRHAWIPTFVSTYLSLGSERYERNLGEHKFIAMEQRFGVQKVKRLSFGVDRERPIPWDAPVWYAQQITPDELTEMKRRKLV